MHSQYVDQGRHIFSKQQLTKVSKIIHVVKYISKNINLSCSLEKPCIALSEKVSVKYFSRARNENALDYVELKFNSFQGSYVCNTCISRR